MTMKQRGREGERNVQASQLGQSVGRRTPPPFSGFRPTTAAELVQATAAGGAGEEGRKEGVLGGKARKMMLSLTQVTPLQGPSEEWAPVAVNQRDYISVFFSAESAGKKQFFFSSDSRNLGHILYYPF